jgi:RNA methyltransferase, TrmH family
LSTSGVRVLAADGAGTLLLPDADLSAPHAWLMGNEAWGLPEELRERCDEVVRVPIYGHAESLNLAMAATVCLYASAGAQHRD